MNIYKNGKYWYVRFYNCNKEIKRSLKLPVDNSRRAAEVKAIDLIAHFKEKVISQFKVSDAINIYLKDRQVKQKELSEFQKVINRFNDCDISNVLMYAEEYDDALKNSSKNRAFKRLNAAVSLCAKKGLCELVKIPMLRVDTDRRDIFLKGDEIDPYIKRIRMFGIQYKYLAEILIKTGARISEVVSGNNIINYKGLKLTTRKGGKLVSRYMPLKDDMIKVVNEFKGMKYKEFRKAHLAVCKAMNLDITIHDLRRTFGTLLLTSGADIRDVMDALGHSRIETTVLYLGKDLSRLRNLVSAL